MKQTNSIQEPGLPEELTTRLHRLADTRTADSRPFPLMDKAIRRARARRHGGFTLAGVLVAAVVAAVVAVEVLTGGALRQADQQGAPAHPRPSISHNWNIRAKTPEQAGYGATGGSLAADRVWLDGLRQQVRTSGIKGEPGTKMVARDVRVVAAGDIGDRARYAVVLVPSRRAGKAGISWTRAFWLGAAGAAPSGMHDTVSSGPGAYVPADPDAYFTNRDAEHDTSHAVAIVVAPGGQNVNITSSLRYLPNGQTPSQGRALTPAGNSVWTGELTADEYLLSQYTVDGQTGSGGTNASAPDFSAVSSPQTDPDLLQQLTPVWAFGKLTSKLVPQYAIAQTFGKGHVVAAVLRSPDNGYLVGLAAISREDNTTVIVQRYSGVTSQGFATSGDVMVAAAASDGEHNLVILAPQNAVQVRAGGQTATVRSRLAELDTSAAADGQQVEALDASGKVIATVRAGSMEAPFGYTE